MEDHYTKKLYLQYMKEKNKDVDKNIIVSNYIYGIGGRDIGVNDIEGIFDDMLDDSNNEKIKYVGLK